MKKLIFILSFCTHLLFSQEKQIEIFADKSIANKLKLNFVKTWGGEKAEDENQFFANPVDLQVDKNGNLFILDASNQRVQYFDKNGKFVKSIGRKGKGTGEFISPVFMYILNEKLYINDIIQKEVVYNLKTNKFESASQNKNNDSFIAVLKTGNIFVSNSLYNKNKDKPFGIIKNNRKIVNFGKTREKDDANFNRGLYNEALTCTDINDNFYAAFIYLPFELYKYDSSGNILIHYTYKKNDFGKNFRYDTELKKYVGTKIITAIASDEKENIYLVVPRREKTEQEENIGNWLFSVGDESGLLSAEIPKNKITAYETDLYLLLIINKNGKILLQKKLDCYYNEIKIFGNRLFLLDGYVEGKIDEFTINYN